jgi:hypothetical protein
MIEGYKTKDMKAKKVVVGEGSEPSQELSARVKILMARKTNQQRKKRRVLPKAIR